MDARFLDVLFFIWKEESTLDLNIGILERFNRDFHVDLTIPMKGAKS